MSISSEVPTARIAYDALAPDYDAFTTGYAHDRWFAALHSQATALGLVGDRALDLACGTGKSTERLIAHGYRVKACDVSPRMVEVARLKLGDSAGDVFVADMRRLPDLTEVDLAVCLDDAINYLLSPDDLVDTFRGARRALRPGGFLVFDVNTLATYRTTFSQVFVREADDRFFAWRGGADRDITAGDTAVAEIEVFTRDASQLWTRTTSRHEQRHHPTQVIVEALETAGLRCCRIDGQRRGGILEATPDELEHIKFVYYALRD